MATKFWCIAPWFLCGGLSLWDKKAKGKKGKAVLLTADIFLESIAMTLVSDTCTFTMKGWSRYGVGIIKAKIYQFFSLLNAFWASGIHWIWDFPPLLRAVKGFAIKLKLHMKHLYNLLKPHTCTLASLWWELASQPQLKLFRGQLFPSITPLKRSKSPGMAFVLYVVVHNVVDLTCYVYIHIQVCIKI